MDAGTFPTVEVLLATYNGAEYLRAQIESILSQDWPSVVILARDDGSSDDTLAILREYVQRFPNRFRLLEGGAPTGDAKWNFLRLMEASNEKYVAFADQDDVWMPDKISVSMNAMRRLEEAHPGEPVLIFSDLVVVDRDLNELFPSFWKQQMLNPAIVHQLPRLLTNNVVTGCTALLNRRLLDLSLQMPPECPMHDRWVALVAASMGQCDFISQPTVRYRQHDKNVVGAYLESTSLLHAARRKRRPDLRMKQFWINQELAAALLRLYGDALPARSREQLEAYLRIGRSSSRWERVALILRYRFFRGGLPRNLNTLWDIWKMKPVV